MRNFTTVFVLIVVAFLTAQAQVPTRLVKGTLTDPETGTPLPGVNIVVKGTSTGTTTDGSGNYEIEAPIGSTLVFSFVGYKSMEVKVEPLAGEASDTTQIHQKVFRHTIPDNPEKTLSPYFFVKSDDPAVDRMPLKSTAATVNISGVIADVHIRQVYVNTGMSTLEAIYIFPGSTRAAVYGMNMTIGDRKLIAKINEKEKARQEYEQAKQVGKTATLLEQKRPNVFQMNVANILPGDTISVDLHYTELLVPVEGTYEFVYPTVVGPRYSEAPNDEQHTSEQWVENPYHHEGEKPDYTFDFKGRLNSGIPIQRITSTSHKVNVNYTSSNNAEITLDETEMLGGNRDVIVRYRLRGGKVESGILLNPRADENFFLLMIEPPDAPSLDEIPPREYIFIVDVSGSMQGFPIDVSKTLLQELISSLRPTDRFNVMLFESSNQMLHSHSVPATKGNISDAVQVLNQQRGSGGTRLYPALQRALEYEKTDGFSRTFIVITDGYVTVEKEAFNLVRGNLNDANLFAFGIGSSVNRHLIEGLAHAGMGEPFIITNQDEAKRYGKKFIDLVSQPVLTDIKIDFGGFDVYDVEPMHIPDVFVERPIIVFGKYKGKAEGNVKLSGFSGSTPYSKRISLAAATSENNEALRYLWARNNIKYLNDFAGYFDDNEQQNSEKRIKEVTQLGLRYNLLTQYTSFIAVDSIIRNKSGSNEKVKQPLPLPAGVSNAAIAIRGFSLLPDVASLSEVIVCGYSVQQKNHLTASVVSVSSEELPVAEASVSGMLQGRVSGVNVVQHAGTPGSNTSLMIRGFSSLNASQTPLYVVDGVPIDNTSHPSSPSGVDVPDRITDLNPNDIASIEVLKSTSATAIYGSRGASGVILVTTKKPKYGKREITVSSSVSIDMVNKLPELQHTYAQGRPESGSLTWKGGDEQESFSWGPALNTLMYDGSSYPFDVNGKLVPRTAGSEPASPYNRYTFFRSGFTADNHLQFSKKGEKSQYGFSVGNKSQSGIIPGTSFNRTSVRLMGEHDFARRFKTGGSASLSHAVSNLAQKGNSGSSIMYGLLTTPASFDNGNGQRSTSAFEDSETYSFSDGTQRSFNGGVTDNPYWSLNKNPFKGTVDRIIPNVYVEYSILDELKLKYGLSGDFYRDKLESGFDIHSAAAPLGRFTNRTEQFKSLNSELMLSGNFSMFNNDITISAMAGLVNSGSQRSINRTDGFEFTKSGSFTPDNVVSLQQYSGKYSQQNARIMTKLTLRYQELLSMDATSVWENTSTLTKGNDRLHSGGVGAAFNFTELPFYNSYVLTNGRVFASVGKIQREAPLFVDPNFYFAATRNVTQTELLPERMAVSNNSNLNAEEVRSLEAGTTLGFWQQRIELTAAWYTGKTNNLFVPVVSGNTVSMMNAGVLANHGFDVHLETVPVQGNVTWNLDVTFSKYTAVVETLAGSADRIPMAGFTSVSSNLMAGQPYSVLYGTRYLRNDAGQLVIGSDGYPIVDSSMGVIGNPNPDWTMGIVNEVSLRGFSLNFLIDIKRGGDVWNGTKNTLNYFGTGAETISRETKQYIFKGVNEQGETNTVPVNFLDPSQPVYENRWSRYGIAGVAEDGIEDGSWVRLRHVSVSYRFAHSIVDKLRLKNLSTTLSARNLFLITRYSGVDPETSLIGNNNGRGMEYFNLPNTRSYTVTLKLGL